MKERIDLFLVEKGYFSSREQAHRAIMAGEVCVNGRRIEKPSQVVVEPAEVTLANQGPVYVSRGAHKLAKAITTFQMDLADRICLDAGASTGGFTDYLLQNGAAKVYAVDVGYGQLAWKLRQDPRVVVVERQNIRYYNLPKREPVPSLITADLSFISLELVLPKFKALIGAGGEMVTLIKPQFEAGKDKVGKKGVVRDPQIHRDILERLIRNAPQSGWNLAEITFSPLLGPEGNIEYLGHWLLTPSDKIPQVDVVVAAAWEELKGSL
jgi:23S rRNA (cytidine1920-2'-O)/16S rRNA (cytidine1409-2'-O)-methyltransferase